MSLESGIKRQVRRLPHQIQICDRRRQEKQEEVAPQPHDEQGHRQPFPRAMPKPPPEDDETLQDSGGSDRSSHKAGHLAAHLHQQR